MTTEAATKRLFVPLSSEPYDWFRSGRKRWELRRYGRQYTLAHVRRGRQVELRRGYRSHQALWGHIVRTVEATSLLSFFDEVPFQQVIPVAKTRDEAVALASSILGLAPNENTRVLGFEIEVK